MRRRTEEAIYFAVTDRVLTLQRHEHRLMYGSVTVLPSYTRGARLLDPVLILILIQMVHHHNPSFRRKRQIIDGQGHAVLNAATPIRQRNETCSGAMAELN